MNTEKPTFAPFAPPPPPMFEGQIPPAGSAVIAAAPAPKRKRSGKKPATAPKAAKKVAPVKRKQGRPTTKQPTGEPAAKRRGRGAPKGKRTPKFELQTILKIAAGLKEADQKLFEAMLGELAATPKAARRRVLAALGNVFG